MDDRPKTDEQLIADPRGEPEKDAETVTRADAGPRPDRDLLFALVDKMLEPTVILDWSGTLLHGNALAAGVLGVKSAHDLAGIQLPSIMHPDALAQAATDLRAVEQSEAEFSATYKLLINGRTVHIESHGTKIELVDGSVDLVSFRDVTSRREQQERDKTTELVLKSVLDNSSTVIFIKDTAGRYLLVNKRYEELFDVTNEDLAGKTDYDIFPEDVAAQLQAKDEKAIEAGTAIEEEEVVPQRDGTHTYLSVKFPLYDAAGKVYATCGISTDITERKRAEAALTDHHDELEARVLDRTRQLTELNRQLKAEVAERKHAQEQAAVFQKLAEASGQGLGMADLNGMTTYLNPAVCRFMGINGPEDGLGRHIAAFHPPETHDQLRNVIVPTVMNQGEWVGEFPLQRKDGSVLPTILNMFLLRDAQNEPQRLAAVLTNISGQKNTEKLLKEEHQRMLTLFDGINEVCYVADPDTYEILFANRFLQEALGRPLVGGICYKEFQGLNEPCGFCTNDKILATPGETYQWEHHNPVLDRHYLVTDRIIRWPDGRDVRFELAIDITERKKAERSIWESERKFRGLAETTTAHISIIQGDRYVYANQAFLDYFDLDEKDLPLLKPEDLMMGMLNPEAIEGAAAAWRVAKESGQTRFRFEAQDAEGRWSQTHVHMMELDGQESVMSMTFDITDLKQAQAKLAQNEKQYRTIFDIAGTAMISFGEDGVITLANDEWCKLSGYSAEETLGRLTWMPFFSDKSLAKMRKYHEMRSRDPSSVPRAYEAQFLDRAGRVHEGIVNIQMVPGTQQRVASFQDLTQLKRAQNEMYRADKMAALGQIIAGVAHEINNPNNFIYFNLPILRRYMEAITPLLERNFEEDPNLKILNMPFDVFREDVFKLLENMEHGSRRITGIVSDLKSYVRSDEDPERKDEQVSQTIERVMTLVGKQVRKMVKRFDVEVTDGLPAVSMNAGKIEQVLINLLINAGQAADKEDSWVKLSARPAAGEGGWIELRVEDNGAGIPEDSLELIFEPFFTSKGRDLGTGLGLSISQRIIEEHGGTIHVDSTVGEGTCFVVSLPAAQKS